MDGGRAADPLLRVVLTMRHLASIAAVTLALASPAAAQIQPGPNLSPSGIPFTFAPRFGYLGPPAAFVYAPPPRSRFMPMIVVPRPLPLPPPEAAPLASPPMRQSEAPAIQARPGRKFAPLPGGRVRPPPPCPDGCPREPDDL
jgi:hypothetical protein